MVEEFIPGRELTVGVLGDRALAVTEIAALVPPAAAQLPPPVAGANSSTLMP